MNYYNKNSEDYFERTIGVDMNHILKEFCFYLKPSSFVLDAGSGSGRDTIFFKNHGYNVNAIDQSYEMSKLSTEVTGIKTENISFSELDCKEIYDGVWANASLLHVAGYEFENSIKKLFDSLKIGGVMFMSFKYGNLERVDGYGRVFNDMNYKKLSENFEGKSNISIEKIWLSLGSSSPTKDNKWINIIIKKVNL